MLTVFGQLTGQAGGAGWALVGALLNGLWPGAALAAAMWLVLRATPWLNATTRYAVWCVTLLAVLALPFVPGAVATLGANAPAARAEVVAESSARETRGGGATPPGDAAPSAETVSGAASASARGEAAAGLPQLRISERAAGLVFALWLLIAAVLTARVLGGYLRLRRLKREAVPLAPEYQARLRQWVEARGVGRPVRVASARGIQMPMAAGLSDAVILIPEGLLAQLTEEEFDQILLHELAHLRRRDDWTFFAQRLVEAALFFHPAVLLIGRKLNLEREVACDDWVITLTGRRRHYATCLTRLIELKVSAKVGAHALAPGVLFGRRQASRRVELLLDKKRNAKPRLCKTGGVVALAALAFMLSQFGRLTPAFVIARAEEARPVRSASPRGDAEHTVAVESVAETAAAESSVESSEYDAASGSAAVEPHAADDVRAPAVQAKSSAQRLGGRLSEADEHAGYAHELRVKELLEPRLREIQHEAAMLMQPEANELARLAHDLTFGKLHEIEMGGRTATAEDRRRVQAEVDEALRSRADALEKKVSAYTEPLEREAEREARRKASREAGSPRK
jgi:beta-lactamase regulating signal transducer with metallopeptidase domain